MKLLSSDLLWLRLASLLFTVKSVAGHPPLSPNHRDNGYISSILETEQADIVLHLSGMRHGPDKETAWTGYKGSYRLITNHICVFPPFSFPHRAPHFTVPFFTSYALSFTFTPLCLFHVPFCLSTLSQFSWKGARKCSVTPRFPALTQMFAVLRSSLSMWVRGF